MKKLIFLFVIALSVVACNNSTKKKNTDVDKEVVFTVDEIQQNGDQYLDKVVVVTGTVSHVCKHGGKRCFLMGSNEDITIRVEAGKKVGSFDQGLMGSDLKVSGILKEIRIDEAYVAEMEASANEGESANKGHALGHDDDGNHEVDGGNHDRDQLKEIAELRSKITDSGKGYHSIYYLEAEKFEE